MVDCSIDMTLLTCLGLVVGAGGVDKARPMPSSHITALSSFIDLPGGVETGVIVSIGAFV